MVIVYIIEARAKLAFTWARGILVPSLLAPTSLFEDGVTLALLYVNFLLLANMLVVAAAKLVHAQPSS